MKSRWLLSLVALALVAAACGGDGGDTTTTTAAGTTTTGGGGDTTTTTEGPAEMQFDTGVTPAPCEDAVNDGNGCIYLGIISDLTTGPFAALGVPLTAAQRDFWAEVNEGGGLDGFDVIIRDEDVIDAHYDGADHAAGYETIRGRVAALAQTLGTPQTQASSSGWQRTTWLPPRRRGGPVGTSKRRVETSSSSPAPRIASRR